MAIDDPLAIERREGKAPGTLIFELRGPVTLRNLFDLQGQLRSGDLPRLAILDLSGVPYMDSAGMGAIINYFVSSQRHGRKLVVAGVNGRVLELFRMTKVEGLLTMKPTIAEAEQALA